MTAGALDVLIAGKLAGTLSQDGAGALSFAYERGYRGIPLSSSMPLSTRPYRDKVVLEVPEKVLTGYDIRNANEAFNYLLELHHIFSGWAEMIDDKPAWRQSNMLGHRTLNQFIGGWNFACVDLKSTDDKDVYQDWKDHYEE